MCVSTTVSVSVVQKRFIIPVLFFLTRSIFNSLCVVTQFQVSWRYILATMAEAKTSQQEEYYSNSKYSGIFQNSDVVSKTRWCPHLTLK